MHSIFTSNTPFRRYHGDINLQIVSCVYLREFVYCVPYSGVERPVQRRLAYFSVPCAALHHRKLNHMLHEERFASNLFPVDAAAPAPPIGRDRRHRYLKKTRRTKKVFNTHVIISENGDIAATYRKIHLFDVVSHALFLQDVARYQCGRCLGSNAEGPTFAVRCPKEWTRERDHGHYGRKAQARRFLSEAAPLACAAASAVGSIERCRADSACLCLAHSYWYIYTILRTIHVGR